MNQSIKSVLALIILICLGASIMGWATHSRGRLPDYVYWMRASGILLVPTIALLAWADFRRDLLPDILKKCAGGYFEQDGFCFAIRSGVKDGHFAWNVLFQNRYERPCKALVAFRPATRFIGFGRADLPEVRIEIDCDGGSFGSATVPYGIPQAYQGKKQRFEVVAVSRYPQGKGKMLRFRQGMRVGKRNKSGADVAVTLLSAMALHAHFKTPARIEVRLPDKVSTEGAGEANQKVLWRPGEPEP